MRSSPTAAAALSASWICAVVIGCRNATPFPSVVFDAAAAQDPAKQSACSSSRTLSDAAPVCRLVCSAMIPPMFWMWCPHSCATTYISASGPPLDPNRERSSS